MLRDLLFYFFLLLIVALIGGFAWLTHHPEAPILERAEEWPLVGELAQRFRRAYLDPETAGERTETMAEAIARKAREAAAGEGRPAPAGSGKERTRQPAPGERPEEPLGLTHLSEAPGGREPAGTPSPPPAGEASPAQKALAEAFTGGGEPVESGAGRPMLRLGFSAPPPPPRPRISYLALEHVWLLPGNRLRGAPAAAADALHHFDAMAYVPVIGRQGRWQEVVYRGRKGWVDSEWQPSLPRKGARQGIVRHKVEPEQSSNWQRLRAAKKILGLKKPNRRLGPYRLFTDVEDEALLDFLDGAAVAAEEAYFARFGRLPSGNPYRSVALFAREDEYREYSSGTSLGGSHVGHATTGLLAFYAEGRPREALASTLVHEITHLMNDRALSWRLPPWLEEGTASDIGSLWVETSAEEPAERPAGAASIVFTRTDPQLITLGETEKAGQLPSVDMLFRLDYLTFHRQGIQAWAYAHSAALVDYLLEGDGGRHAAAFREFLKRIAGGHGADPRLLMRLLEMDADELDSGFRAWLRLEAEAARERFREDARRALG